MAKVTAGSGANGELVIGLRDPGLTPMLRAGLGGLAASIRAIGIAARPRLVWPSPVRLGPGKAVVEPSRVVLRWGGDPEATLRALFEGSFQVREGIVYLPAVWDRGRWDLAIAAALQSGLKRTFLQHGKTTKKAGTPVTRQVEIDDRTYNITFQPYAGFAHQEALKDVVKGLKSGQVELAGWANPGAVKRHDGYGETKWSYTPAQALCGLFALAGCLSFEVTQSGGAGALVILEPSDLVHFAETRPRLSPAKARDAYVAGASDAVLRVHLLLRMEASEKRAGAPTPGIAATHGVTLRPTPWASQQKSRVSTVSPSSISAGVLAAYDVATHLLPTRIVPRKSDDGAADEENAGYFAVASALRGFVADNLANGQRWFKGFSTATTTEKQPRYLHRIRTRNDTLGALRVEEKEGLLAMTETLEEAEKHFVRSIHRAISQRLGAIAKECIDSGASVETRNKRWQGERDKWRIAFAGAKTHEQIRGALADLWSRAGVNVELRQHWEEILPLLRADRWQDAKDLALIALASYQGKGTKELDEADEGAGEPAELGA